MAIKKEIKAKYKIDDIDFYRKKIKSLAKKIDEGKISDFYFKKSGSEDNTDGELRLRKNENGKVITLKIPVKSDLFQKSEEYSFIVDDADDFAKFLEWADFKLDSILHKKVEEYFFNDSIVRFVEIDNKNKFIEIIIESFGEITSQIEDNLKDTAKKLGLHESYIESRYYCSLK